MKEKTYAEVQAELEEAQKQAEENPIKELLKEADVNMYAEKNLNLVIFGKRFANIMSQKVST